MTVHLTGVMDRHIFLAWAFLWTLTTLRFNYPQGGYREIVLWALFMNTLSDSVCGSGGVMLNFAAN